MSYDETDAMRDQFIDDLYEDFTKDVLSGRDETLYIKLIDRFTSERLQSFYIDNPNVAAPALWALGEARALIGLHPSAAPVFAVVGVEVGLKATLLKPILHGLVHSEFAAAWVTVLAPDHRNDNFRDLLFAILTQYGGIDLKTFRRPVATRTLWEEITEAQKKRNAVLHRAEAASRSDAEQAIIVANIVLEQLFPGVLSKLGLHTHPGLVVCGAACVGLS